MLTPYHLINKKQKLSIFQCPIPNKNMQNMTNLMNESTNDEHNVMCPVRTCFVHSVWFSVKIICAFHCLRSVANDFTIQWSITRITCIWGMTSLFYISGAVHRLVPHLSTIHSVMSSEVRDRLGHLHVYKHNYMYVHQGVLRTHALTSNT